MSSLVDVKKKDNIKPRGDAMATSFMDRCYTIKWISQRTVTTFIDIFLLSAYRQRGL